MSSEKTLAIVIRLIEFSESSYVATLFTEDFGKITGLAKGARRAKSAFENALDLLAVSRVMFLRKSSDAMDLLTEAKLERRFRAGQRELIRLYGGYYVAELLHALTDERDPHPRLFRISLETLASLDGTAHVADVVLRFELATLQELGQLPELESCVECGLALPAGVRVAFGTLAGGVLCAKCKVGKRQVVSLSSAGLAWLKSASRDVTQPLVIDAEATGDSTTRHSTNEVTSPAARGEVRGLMNQLISHVLGRRPKMYAFLTGLR